MSFWCLHRTVAYNRLIHMTCLTSMIEVRHVMCIKRLYEVRCHSLFHDLLDCHTIVGQFSTVCELHWRWYLITTEFMCLLRKSLLMSAAWHDKKVVCRNQQPGQYFTNRKYKWFNCVVFLEKEAALLIRWSSDTCFGGSLGGTTPLVLGDRRLWTRVPNAGGKWNNRDSRRIPVW